jgi:hypothetical protein
MHRSKICSLTSMAIIPFLAILLSGCGKPTLVGKDSREIVSVWKHEVGYYSVSFMDGNKIVDNGFKIYNGNYYLLETTTLIADVPEGSNMWYEAIYLSSIDGGSVVVTIHVRSMDDVHGAGWNHGKFGKGSTERVR